MKILIVEDDEASRNYLEIILKKENCDFRSAVNGKEGLAVFKEYTPDLVLTDISMAQMNGIELLGEIKKIRPETIVIMLTAYNNENYVVACMKLGANNYLKKPIPRIDVITLVRKYLSIVSNWETERKISDFVHKNTLKLRFKTDINIINAVVNYLVKETEELYTEEAQLDLKLGLNELILNAVEHGNLGISFLEKNEAVQNDSLPELYEERLSIEKYANKEVEIEYIQRSDAAEWIIRDQGDGFNPGTVPNPLSDDGVLRLHGRGIFICKFQFDELEYIGKGNIVRVLKKF